MVLTQFGALSVSLKWLGLNDRSLALVVKRRLDEVTVRLAVGAPCC